LACDPTGASPDDAAALVRLLAGGSSSAAASAAEVVVGDLVRQGCVPGSVAAGVSLRSRVRTRPWAAARRELLEELGGIGFAGHWSAAAGRPWQQLSDRLVRPLRARLEAGFQELGGQLGEAVRLGLVDAIHGQFDAAWLPAFLPAPGDGPDGADGADGLAALATVARHAGWWWAFENVAVLTERPTAIHRDNLGRLHHAGGPALAYPDGYGLFAWRGMPFPAEVAAGLDALTVERIRGETNAEVRRVMLEHFGFERYLQESGALKVNEDECGVLWRVVLPGDEPLVMVEVVNATAEPDGTFRIYFLRVPPTTRTARAGVAWTFDLPEDQYAPVTQT
jgi:hypothetical protein